jgi:hypothetical protein
LRRLRASSPPVRGRLREGGSVTGTVLQFKTVGISGVGTGEQEEDDDMFSRGDTVCFVIVIVAGTRDVEAASLAALN